MNTKIYASQDWVKENVSTKMNADNPAGTGSFSMNRKSGTTVGNYSHAEGLSTTASGSASHAEGEHTTASSNYQHVQGKYNIADTSNVYAHIVGNGTSDTEHSNAHTLDWEGNAWYYGDVYVGSTSGTNRDEGSKKLATVEEVQELASQISSQSYVAQTEAPEDKKLLWLDLDDESDDEGLADAIQAAIADVKNVAIPAPEVAEVGQTVVVKEVDESGKPVAWEAVNLPSGGGGGGSSGWEYVTEVTTTEEVVYVALEIPENATEIFGYVITPASETLTSEIIAHSWYEDKKISPSVSIALQTVRNQEMHGCVNACRYGNKVRMGQSLSLTYPTNGAHRVYGGRWYDKRGSYFVVGTAYGNTNMPTGTTVYLYAR